MFGAARDPFAFIRNGIRLHSTEEWRGKKVAGRIRFILSSLVLVDAMERWNGRLQGMEGAVSVEQEGGSRDKGSPVDGLKYGGRYKESGAAQQFEKKYRSGDRKGRVVPSRVPRRKRERRKKKKKKKTDERRREGEDACRSSG